LGGFGGMLKWPSDAGGWPSGQTEFFCGERKKRRAEQSCEPQRVAPQGEAAAEAPKKRLFPKLERDVYPRLQANELAQFTGLNIGHIAFYFFADRGCQNDQTDHIGEHHGKNHGIGKTDNRAKAGRSANDNKNAK